MKVIFLDIEGVLNTFDTPKDSFVDEFRIGYLKEIIDATDAKVVLSSSLRGWWNTEDFTLRTDAPKDMVELSEKFKKFDVEIYGITPKYRGGNRQDEIYLWLEMHPEVKKFIVFDDEPTFSPDFIGKELIKTSKVKDDEIIMDMRDYLGILPEHIQIAIDKLGAKRKL